MRDQSDPYRWWSVGARHEFLRAFHAVCESGGFSRAAAQLNCTQPAITYQVRALERDLGAKLFERGGRKAVLTPAGHRMYDFSCRYFAELAQLSADVADGTDCATIAQ
jgi:DNA-binding transcriptional LysR family regulator